MSLEPLQIRGSFRNRLIAVSAAGLFAAIGVGCGFILVKQVRSADTFGAWFGVAVTGVVSVLCVLLGARYGWQSLSGGRVTMLLDGERLRIDRSAIGGGILSVRWKDVEAVHRNGFALGLALRSPDSLLADSDEVELRRISDTGWLIKIGTALKLTSGPLDLIEHVTSDGGPAGSSRTESELGRRVLRALAAGRKLGGYDLGIPYWELDRGTKAMSQLLESRVAAHASPCDSQGRA